MAFAARHLLMRAHQLESRGAVVKFGFMPALVLMAALTTAFLHTLGKLSGVGIAVARGAALIRKNKKQFAGEWSCGLARVTIATRHRLMRSQQHKCRFLMRG